MFDTISERSEAAIEQSGRPSNVLEAFVRLIETGDVGSAIGSLSGAIINRIGRMRLEEIFFESSLDIWSAGGVEIVDVRTLAFSADHAEMELIIWYGDHKHESEVVEMIREDGAWKIALADGRIPEAA